MTARLVGLIILLLSASLAATWVLVGHFQGRLMDEVARTVTAVGEATLRTVEAPVSAEAVPDVGASRPVAAARSGREEIVVGGAHGRTVVALDRAAVVFDSARGPYVVDPGKVQARLEPGRGLIMRLPAFEAQSAGGAGGRVGDIVVPVPTRDYAALLQELRRESLAVFAGVFGVGVLLAALIGMRVTRPVRELDAALRRLSDGDLSAEVRVRGGDEVARLGAAFNGMISRLREAREREQELARRENLAALGRLAAGVAHDVRNPLHSIGLVLAHLRAVARPEDPERARELDRGVALVGGEIRRLDRLVEGYLRLSRADGGATARGRLGDVVREVVALVERDALRRRIALRIEADADAPELDLRVSTVRSAILDVVLNAFQAMPAGGTLVLRVRPAGGEVILEVEDSGRGIDPRARERLFDFAYSGRAGGTGVGLAMVRRCVVEEHGGRVDISSEMGRGTTVVMAFPERRG